MRRRRDYMISARIYAVQTLEPRSGELPSAGSAMLQGTCQISNGACGSMSIPRVLHVKDGRLYQNPVQGIYQLIRYPVYEGCDENVELSGIEGNTYYVRLELEHSADFRMTLYKWKDRKALSGAERRTVPFPDCRGRSEKYSLSCGH